MPVPPLPTPKVFLMSSFKSTLEAENSPDELAWTTPLDTPPEGMEKLLPYIPYHLLVEVPKVGLVDWARAAPEG